ncbi:Type I site-specific deoxyribonuclease [Thalassoporum mexicanum PCC 7367]|uniref:DEAD/DEAH box helicase family protein n=1 Tax=Thalassoporum mexicanum TaxID=3457544 RepID=UPI00029FB941|nr:DEAD/DEAH box helicase family protein [Pseudanabaena sp. PCC 7367]AFY69170.1 Type I site-specific deoxyribonuclease [Pseudanabaena sp. PCC 7367]
MASNFDFLKPSFPKLYDHFTKAEELVFAAPRASCFYARFALEQAVLWLYANDPYLQMPYETRLGSLVHEPTFKNNLSQDLFAKVRTILKVGNMAVHDPRNVGERDALQLVQELFHFSYWLGRYYGENGRQLGEIKFNRDLIPQPTATGVDELSQQQLEQLEQQLDQTERMRQIAEQRQQQTEAELERVKAEIARLKAQNQAIADVHDYNEADTRVYLIDVLLKEAGWLLTDENREVELEGMPNETGKGYADYVLWGDNGKPLAVIEAKRTTHSPDRGKQQVKLYANCLEAKYDQRPVMFYTNGYSTYIWDDKSYPPRQIQGFLRQEELESIIFRRTHRKRLHLLQTNDEIINRSYQKEAISSIAKSFDVKKMRKALLVMATGTGKTRTAIALVDLLKRANWVKRVLFLADRNSLITQAKRAFRRHLPTVTATTLKKTNRADIEAANVILATYPSMFNAIDRIEGGERLFGSGYFDLVIVDEAHRSIYQKYKALFEYFDALLIGLTATPRDEVDRDTYEVFALEQGVPTFAYELGDAIADGYLVPALGVDVPFKFLRSGVKFSDLSPAEQLEYEAKFRDEDTGEVPDQVNAAAINQWLFNKNTVEQALELLMEQGLKVEGGDRLGKTIIFARNHRHAEFIVDCFDANYPHYNGEFARIIDSHDKYAQSLLDEFSDSKKQPTIAVSVDMLDTGVDVPEVVNLVFFKPVYSRVKFNQMIGRGTRLCPDLFGVNRNKTEFFVFDLCGNFDFFNQDIADKQQRLPETLTTKLVKQRLALAQLLSQTDANGDPIPGNQELRENLLNDLHLHVDSMPQHNFMVRRQLEYVEEFANRDRWNNLSDEDTEIIVDRLAKLPNGLPSENHLAKEFDLLCLRTQLALINQTNDFERLRDKIRDLLARLEQKRDIPMVKTQLALITEVQNESWWIDVTPPMIEQVRLNLRELIKFIDKQQQEIVYTDFADQMGEVELVDVPTKSTGFSREQYKKKVETYIRENDNHTAIAKIKRNLPLTEADLAALEDMLFKPEVIESQERFNEVYGEERSLKLFIRKLVGLDRSAAKQAFSRYLQTGNFSAAQIRFVETIIDYLTQHGVMDPAQLYEPPFTNLHQYGLDGLFSTDIDADNIVEIVRSFNKPVDADYNTA